MNRRMAYSVVAIALLASGCQGGGSGGEPPPRTPEPLPRLCASALPGTVGVAPIRNETKASVELAGTDDLIMTAMSDTGCFRVLERDQLAVLVEEMRLCSAENPDQAFFDCASFPQKGKLMGVQTMVVGALTFYEPDVKGADLGLKIPGLGGLEAGRSYAALTISLRAVDVETAQHRADVVVHAVVPSDEAGVDLAAGGVSIRAAAYQRTPMAEALQSMLQDAVKQLRSKLAG